MNKKSVIHLLAVLFLLLWSSSVIALQNPDQITVFFPAFDGPDKLGLNVSTILSLQLAQTTRRHPWPENPKNHDFGEGMIRWSAEPLENYSVSKMMEIAQSNNLLAQIVVAGKAKRYGRDIVVELDIVLPKYRKALSLGSSNYRSLKRDFRKKNFELWQITLEDRVVEVDVPRRYFNISTIVLKPDVVNKYITASGLTIRDSYTNGRVIGKTDENLRFIEFNKRLPGAPTKVRSGGVEGYVSLPELSDDTSEFADMIGGILQVFRGDWDAANRSFTNVIENVKTRVPLKVDALLYRGMVKYKNRQNGYADILAAAELAPYDSTVIRYLFMALLEDGKDKDEIEKLLERQSYLFDANDEWLDKMRFK